MYIDYITVGRALASVLAEKPWPLLTGVHHVLPCEWMQPLMQALGAMLVWRWHPCAQVGSTQSPQLNRPQQLPTAS